MTSSELSNALNPYINQPRHRPTYQTPYEHPPQPQPQPYIPHRSELEHAFSEPPPPPPPPANVAPARQPNPANVQAVQELLRIVASTRESQEIERQRRLEWEREQEVKYAQRQTEMEKKISELTQEVISLRATQNQPTPPNSGLLTPQFLMSPALAIQPSPQPVSPISPVSQPSPYSYPPFVQGSSNQPFLDPQSYDQQFQQSPHPEPIGGLLEMPLHSLTPSPSPHLSAIQPNQAHHTVSAPVSRSHGKKRQSSELSSDDDESNSSDSSSTSNRRIKRSSHHDTRCLTIHHAMRKHLILMMMLENDKHLPDSHTEGLALGANDPVRFVWEKTTKQSVHNSRMKARVISDLKDNRRKYRHVPDKDFGKKSLESTFEACFVTLRQKFKAQQDPELAQKSKQREDAKARRARHVSRKKTKLNARADARMRFDALEHVIFDGALQLECMSSEDSGDDGDGSVLYTRGHQWRSCRLQRFYNILDDEERADKALMPKRGVGRKERCSGPPKEFALPPDRIATWMISKQWIKASEARYPDIVNALAKRIEDPRFDWGNFHLLGEESDDESETYTYL
ncbi:hypothetical protein H0H92_011005 [Tricholoma furcatifolium]|nr:hypothetical protein H0H92_011005 [Tricholoma furcatifolium]